MFESAVKANSKLKILNNQGELVNGIVLGIKDAVFLARFLA